MTLLCRFYGFELEKVLNMTIRQAIIMLNEINEIIKLEMGDEKTETSLSGEPAFMLAKKIFKPMSRR